MDELRACRRACHSPGSDFTIPGAGSHYPPDLSLEPVHLDIGLVFRMEEQRALGSVGISVRGNRAGARSITLDAVDFQDVTVEDAGTGDISSSYDGREMKVTWKEPFEKGEVRVLRIGYAVERPVSGLVFTVPDEDYPGRARWVATDHETERARYWLPCVDQPAIRTTLSFHLTAPEEFTILANGLLVSEEVGADGMKTAHWSLSEPCPSYLVCIAAGEFVRAADESVDGRAIEYYGARGRATEEDLLRSFGRTPEIMRWLQDRLGVAFPYPKYFQFALPQFGGAMENISLVSWDDVFVLDEVLAREFKRWTDIINVHEMAHSYFGDAVVIRDFAHAWLKESWATYIETCWTFDVEGDDEGRYKLFLDAKAYIGEADQRYVRPIVTRVFNSSWNMYDLHLYPGGACRIHMLRRLLGDTVFWAAVRDYLERYSGKTVETEDFRRILEEHSGFSLVEFFEQWIFGRGYPKLKLTFSHDAKKAQGTLTVEQAQVPEVPAGEDSSKKPEWTRFRFPLTIAWETGSGDFERMTFEVENRKHAFVFPLESAPRQIRVDPDDDLLFHLDFNPGDGMLRRALRRSPDVTGRILAAMALGKTGKPANIDALGKAFRKEPFWGVRREIVRALGASKSAAAVRLLSELMAEESHPWVQHELAVQAGAFRDPKVERGLLTLLDRKPGYMTMGAALHALGKQRGVLNLERLLEASDADDYRHFIRIGGLRGLGETRTEEAFYELKKRVGYGRELDESSPAAAEALATCASFLERRLRDQAVEDLRHALRDPRVRVRMAAARALATLEAKEAVPDLEAALASLAEQEHPTIRRIIAALAGDPGQASESAGLRKQIETLEEKGRKLEERIDKLEATGRAKSKKRKGKGKGKGKGKRKP